MYSERMLNTLCRKIKSATEEFIVIDLGDNFLLDFTNVSSRYGENYYDDGSDAYVIEVRSELYYDEMSKLTSKLDHIVKSVLGTDLFYFEQIEPGIAQCWIAL